MCVFFCRSGVLTLHFSSVDPTLLHDVTDNIRRTFDVVFVQEFELLNSKLFIIPMCSRLKTSESMAEQSKSNASVLQKLFTDGSDLDLAQSLSDLKLS